MYCTVLHCTYLQLRPRKSLPFPFAVPPLKREQIPPAFLLRLSLLKGPFSLSSSFSFILIFHKNKHRLPDRLELA